MKLSGYAIPYIALKQGIHHYDFEVESEFFDQFEYSEISEGKFDIHVKLEKTSSMMVLWVDLQGTMRSNCDVCLETLIVDVKNSYKSIIKFGDETDSFDSEIRIFGSEVYEIDMKPYIFEYAHLAIPSRKVHEDEMDCNQDVLDKLDNIRAEDEDQTIDPRWDKLKNL